MIAMLLKLKNRFVRMIGFDEIDEVCIYKDFPDRKVELYDAFNKEKSKFYNDFKNDKQLKIINKRKKWHLDVSRIENNMQVYNPREYDANKNDFKNGSPIYNGDVSNFYGKEVKIKRVFYNKEKALFNKFKKIAVGFYG